MSLKVLIVPDKFKGTLTSEKAALAIAEGWRQARRTDALELLPMSDGGDGFGQVMAHLLGARIERVRARDAAGRGRTSEWYWDPKSQTAIIESAKTIGLAMLPPRQYHPFNLDTAGLGPVFKAAWKSGARKCLVGIGGSATNDGGFGVARACGWNFLRRDGTPITSWTDLEELDHLAEPEEPLRFEEFIVAVDVQNPLLGAKGCSRIYGPQKGLKARDFEKAERCLGQLAKVVKQHRGADIARLPGAGAAGGLGFGLRAFFNASLESGFSIFAEAAQLDGRITSADLVITGEGSIDRSTLMGKGVGEIAHRCKALEKPCLGLGGVVPDPSVVQKIFTRARGLVELTSADIARKKPSYWLQKLAAAEAAGI